MNFNKKYIGFTLIIIITIISLIILFKSNQIKQNQSYHNFSDFNVFYGINNFWNVVSNLPFLLIGIFGIFQLRELKNIQYFIFFSSVAFVAFGSGYYHMKPSNETLIWDRIPMTGAFMSLISIIISDYFDFQKGKKLLFPLIILGLFSILFWVKYDDLRLYALIQYYPILVIPVLLIFFKSNNNLSSGYWKLILFYIIAKFLELYDKDIHQITIMISGHTLKHIFAAIGISLFLKTLLNNKNSIKSHETYY